MGWQEVLKSIDDLVFARTGKHLDSLQAAILKGVFDGQKYAEIANEYKCTVGHVKDEGYELWQILSEVIGEDLNKSNFRATVERLGLLNSHYKIIGNPVQIGNINFCSNLGQTSEGSELDDLESLRTKSATQVEQDEEMGIETVLLEAKLKTVPKLAELGLTAQQIAQALDLPLAKVQQASES